MFLSLDIRSLLYGIFVFKSIAIIVPCVIICSFYQCIVNYPCGFANILRISKTLLVLSIDLVASIVYCIAVSSHKIDSMIKTADIIK